MPFDSLPALLGGSPVCPGGPPDWPIADEDVLQALHRAYQNGDWGKYHGNQVTALEDRLREYFAVEFAAACGSGTFAVELALRGLKVGPGDEVILAAYDYPGNFLSVHAVSAQPVLVDIAPHNWNLCLERVADALGLRTRAIIASHLHGGLLPMRRLREVAAAHDVPIIEDAAQCPGAIVEGRKAGTWGDVGTLSFGGSKLLSAGRGGAVLTQRADLFQRMRLAMMRGNLVCPLSELQAAVLLPQLSKLDSRHAHRAANVHYLRTQLAAMPGLQAFVNQVDGSAGYYKVGWQYDADQFGLPRELFVKALRAEGIAFDAGFRALHVGRSRSRYRAGTALTEADRAHHGTVILHHPVLLGTAADMDDIALSLRKVQTHAESLRPE